MSNRYYALVAIDGCVLFDSCVDVGKPHKRMGIADTIDDANKMCAALNAEDGMAKAAWDKVDWALKQNSRCVGVDLAEPGADRTVFTMDVETHAKRYFVGPGGLAVYGSAAAIDTLRIKLNGRYQRALDLQQALTRTRGHLKDAQNTADTRGKELEAARSADTHHKGQSALAWYNKYWTLWAEVRRFTKNVTQDTEEG